MSFSFEKQLGAGRPFPYLPVKLNFYSHLTLGFLPYLPLYPNRKIEKDKRMVVIVG